MSARPKRTAGYWLRLIGVFMVTLYVTAILVLPLYFSIRSIRPAQTGICCETPANRGLQYQDISFTTADGITLRGWYIPSKNGAVVIALHPYGLNRLAVLDQAGLLAKHGYGVLLYDQRASGESDGESLSWGWRDVPDVSAAVRFMKTIPGLDPQRIGLYGCSTGAEISLAATALDPSIRAVAAEDAEYASARDLLFPPTFTDLIFWPINPIFVKFMEWRSGTSAPIALIDAVKLISPRSLFLIGSGKSYDAWQAKYYYDLAGEPKILWNVPEAAHCQSMLNRPDEYGTRLIGFFDGALLDR
jgi:uncharacterized protein